MSPTKPTMTAKSPRPAKKPSAIPRRVKTTSTSSKSKKPSSVVLGTRSKKAAEKVSVLSNATAKDSSSSSKSYFSSSSTSNKENMPPVGLARPRESASRPSPTRGKTGISRKLAKYSPLKRSVLARIPLRELSEVEVFERDEAALGDIRRRRSGEHSGTYIEFDSHNVHPGRQSSVSSSLTDNTIVSRSTAITEANDDEKISVLRRTDSAEQLRLKVEAIMAATSNSTGVRTRSKLSSLRHKLTTPKKEHPAVRTSISPVYSLTNSFVIESPEKKIPASPSLNSLKSPVLARRSDSPIRRLSPSPIRPARIGLGKKSANMILKEVEKSSKTLGSGKTALGEKKKMVISANNKTLGGAPKAKKAGSSSLRRAAGARSAVNSAISGLENIRRMR